MHPQTIRYAIQKYGFIFLPSFKKDKTTLEISSEIGQLLEPNKYYGYENKNIITKLQPQNEISAANNTYSKEFGKREFPFHTDLAHWINPPQFVLLRCIVGDSTAKTHVISIDSIIREFTLSKIRRAIFKTRASKTRASILMTAYINNNSLPGIRWDSLFLEPENSTAKELSSLLRDYNFTTNSQISFTLSNPGDTLIFDNTRNIHGRSVISNSSNRHIERTYLCTLK